MFETRASLAPIPLRIFAGFGQNMFPFRTFLTIDYFKIINDERYCSVFFLLETQQLFTGNRFVMYSRMFLQTHMKTATMHVAEIAENP